MAKTVLFDIDGTLFDTALDFAHVINLMLANRKLPELDFTAFRRVVSNGSEAMVQQAFGIKKNHADFAPLITEFLDLYSQHMGSKTQPFPGVENLLKALDEKNMIWGVVSNRLAENIAPFLARYPLPTPHCIVGANTTPHRKPHPAPLLYAAEQLGVAPSDCLYVGDYPTDIEAAHAAGMVSVAVSWGYVHHIEALKSMKPHHLVNHSGEILTLIMP